MSGLTVHNPHPIITSNLTKRLLVNIKGVPEHIVYGFEMFQNIKLENNLLPFPEIIKKWIENESKILEVKEIRRIVLEYMHGYKNFAKYVDFYVYNWLKRIDMNNSTNFSSKMEKNMTELLGYSWKPTIEIDKDSNLKGWNIPDYFPDTKALGVLINYDKIGDVVKEAELFEIPSFFLEENPYNIDYTNELSEEEKKECKETLSFKNKYIINIKISLSNLSKLDKWVRDKDEINLKNFGIDFGNVYEIECEEVNRIYRLYWEKKPIFELCKMVKRAFTISKETFIVDDLLFEYDLICKKSYTIFFTRFGPSAIKPAVHKVLKHWIIYLIKYRTIMLLQNQGQEHGNLEDFDVFYANNRGNAKTGETTFARMFYYHVRKIYQLHKSLRKDLEKSKREFHKIKNPLFAKINKFFFKNDIKEYLKWMNHPFSYDKKEMIELFIENFVDNPKLPCDCRLMDENTDYQTYLRQWQKEHPNITVPDVFLKQYFSYKGRADKDASLEIHPISHHNGLVTEFENNKVDDTLSSVITPLNIK